MHAHIRIYVSICINLHLYSCLPSGYLYMYIYTDGYIYMYIYTDGYIYMYIYTY